ncbi:glycosyltransferase [Vulcanibacillus modesticaldus]|uniref:glycosyltransferase n=1 Tax=Vulcanibacillus modesticaldus TaxID=337097 RepID=UPI0009FE1CDF
MEGLASGKPFVASKVEGLKEIVGGHGLLFESGNSDELGNILEKLLNNPDFYEDISFKCTKRAEDFDINSTIELTLAVYNKLLN